MALRKSRTASPQPARVRYRTLDGPTREDKFAAFDSISLEDDGWVRVPGRAARVVPAQGVRCLGRLCAGGGHLHVQRLRRDAGQGVGYCPGQAIARSALECPGARAKCLEEGNAVSPPSCEWGARRQACEQAAEERPLRSRISHELGGDRRRAMYRPGTIRLPVV